MSLAATRAPSACERTPNEIWNVIHALVADYTTDCHLAIPWRNGELDDRLKEEATRRDLINVLGSTRRDLFSVMNVCRAWHALAIPWLYTTLSFSRPTSVSTLADHLESSQASPEQRWGRFTREVIVLLPTYQVGGDEVQRAHVARCVARVVRCCPQLEVYVCFASGMFAEPRDIMQVLPKTLRHVHWAALGPGFRSWTDLLARATGLRSLRMTSLYVSSDLAASDTIQPPVLLHLDTLIVNGGAPGAEFLLKTLVTWELPALRDFTLSIPLIQPSNDAMLAFLRRFGPQLRFLSVPGINSRDQILDDILKLCPSLECFTMSFKGPRFERMASLRPAHPSITIVGLESAFKNMADLRPEHMSSWEDIIDNFSVERFPALRRLRLSSVLKHSLGHDVNQNTGEFWQHRIAAAASRGVVLEDAWGRPLLVQAA